MLKHCLVLSARESRENALTITLLHPQLGKQEFLAKGAKRTSAKLAPWLMPLYIVNLWVTSTKGGRAIIQDVELVANITPSYYLGLKCSLRILSLLEKVSYPSLECTGLMLYSIQILSRISTDRMSLAVLNMVWIRFELSILAFLGAKPAPQEIRGKNVMYLSRHLEQKINYHLSL